MVRRKRGKREREREREREFMAGMQKVGYGRLGTETNHGLLTHFFKGFIKNGFGSFTPFFFYFRNYVDILSKNLLKMIIYTELERQH